MNLYEDAFLNAKEESEKEIHDEANKNASSCLYEATQCGSEE